MDYNYITSLPYEVQLDILYKTGYPEIVNVCQTNKELSYLCADDYLWYQLSLKDFSDIIDNKDQDESYHDFYINNYQYNLLLQENYPSLYRMRPQNSTYEQFYMEIEGYIEEKTFDLIRELGIDLTDEVLNEILDIFRDFSSHPLMNYQTVPTITQQLRTIFNSNLGFRVEEFVDNTDEISLYVTTILLYLMTNKKN